LYIRKIELSGNVEQHNIVKVPLKPVPIMFMEKVAGIAAICGKITG
jgi:hypothetical protein